MENKHSNYIHPELYTYDDNPAEWERRFLKPELTPQLLLNNSSW